MFMFVETITQPEDEWNHWNEKLRVYTDPPSALVASIAWNNGDGTISALNLWDDPSKIAELYIERVLPIVETEGEPEHKPVRHGEPVAVYLRE